jgi:hypothetical protein
LQQACQLLVFETFRNKRYQPIVSLANEVEMAEE